MRKRTFLNAAIAILVICSSLLGSIDSFAQNRTISGKVVDQNGDPVIGASLVLVGNNKVGTVTDIDGLYTLSVPANAKLTVSSIGYTTETVSVGSQSVINVKLSEDTELLEETVVIGYGVQKKSDLTGAISSVSSDALENRSVNNVANAVAGKVAGVMVFSNSGDPGSVGTIRVRGVSSNSNSANEPLYIIDGLQVSDLKTLDPQNVESIEVLKDAASAAIYGAQAGNGVVVITTKTAKKGEGTFFYNGSYSIEKLGYHPTMMNAEQYIDYAIKGGLLTEAQIMDSYDGVTDTDWFEEFFEVGYAQRHTVGLQGASDKANYYTSISFLDNDGIVYGSRDRLQRLNIQLNASYQIKKWIKVGTTNTFQIRQSSGRMGSMGGSDNSIMSRVYAMDPLTPMLFPADQPSERYKQYLSEGKRLLTVPSGEYIAFTDISVGASNPLVDIYKDTENESKNLNLNGTLYLNLTPFKGFTFTSRLGYRLSASNSHSFTEPWYFVNETQETEYSFSESAGWGLQFQWENFANYTVKIAKKHQIDAMAGMSYIESNNVSINGSTNTLKDYEPQFRYLSYSTADAIDNIGGTRSKSASLAYFGRLGYNYDSRYYFQVNFRADAFDSSKLSRSARWGYFPSLSAGWTVTNEPWMKGVDRNKVSFLKLRASWGINGNVGVLSGYKYATTVTVGGTVYNLDPDETLTLASYPNGLSNDDLKWETSKQTDIGIDARFLNNRLSATFDYYNKNTDDLLVSVTSSYTTGQGSVMMNAGSINNHGYELELSWKDHIGDFNYSVSGNIATNKNKVTYLHPSITQISGADVNNGHDGTLFKVGYPVWYMSGYVFEGVDPETGNSNFKDIDGDGKITSSDVEMIGSAQPDFTYGITLTGEYKGFDLTLFGSGSQGNDIWFTALKSSAIRNHPAVFYTDAWKQPGDNARYPRYGQCLQPQYARSSACVYDGSYFRINQIQLGYTLPESLLKKVKIQNVRLYVSIDDWFTFSKYIGFDPVTAGDDSGSGRGIDRGTYPSSKKAMVGLNLSF